MRILLTGRDGQVGWELRRALAPLGEVVAAGRPQLDLADAGALARAVRDTAPALIVNAAAYTAVDRAESEPEAAMAVNGTAPGVLAEEARRADAALVHFSTDYVFAGDKAAPYVEDDAPRPLGAYGRSKLAGEAAVRSSGARHLILRTSWVYGARGRNFLVTMLRLAREREELRVVDDQTGAPTWSRMIAEATVAVVAGSRPRRRADAALFAETGGVYHLTAQGATTWCEFARAILRAAPALGLDRVPRVVPIATAEYPSAAARPLNSRLAGDKIRDTFGIALPPWDAALRLCIEDMGR
jgi:dTDP-4-dehydrorhamnose reductase